jgi:methenyltetrahydrofolate cyclohydrolase
MRTGRSSDSPSQEPSAGTSQPGGQASYAELPVGAFLNALAAGSAAPAGGSAAALVLAQAAALCAKAARLSERQLTAPWAAAVTDDAERIRAEAAWLIDEDARAYGAVLAQSRRPPGDARSAGLAAALSDAADVPLRIIELAVPAAGLAADLAAECKPALRGDAVAAGELAQAAARAAAALVTINLAAVPDDPRHARAGTALAAIAARLAGAAAVRGEANRLPGNGPGRV